jgi:hypothetical protein
VTSQGDVNEQYVSDPPELIALGPARRGVRRSVAVSAVAATAGVGLMARGALCRWPMGTEVGVGVPLRPAVENLRERGGLSTP